MSNGLILDNMILVNAVETSGPGTAPIINGPRVPTDSSGDVPTDETDPDPFTGSITVGIEGPNVSGSTTEIPVGTRLSIQASTNQIFYASVMEDEFFQFEDFGTAFDGVAMDVLYSGPPEFRSRTFFYDNPPIFAGVEVLRFEVQSVDDGMVTLYLGLSENRPARINYGTTSALGQERIVTLGTDYGNDANAPHIYALDGLTNDQVYYFQMDDPVDGSYTTSIIQGTPTGEGTVTDPNLVMDTVISDVTETSMVASITFSQGAIVRNYVDTVNPPVSLYSTQDDYETSEHASPITGLTPGTTYYVQQIGEFSDGTIVTGTVRTQKTVSAGGVTGPAYTARTNTRYVSNTGSDADDGLTEDTAWASVMGNIDEFPADTELVYLSGTFDFSTSFLYDVSLPANITLRAKNFGEVILKGDLSLAEDDDNGMAVYLYTGTGAGIEIHGFHFQDWRGSHAGVILAEGDVDGLRVIGNKFTNCGTSQFTHIVYFSGGTSFNTTQRNFAINDNEVVMVDGSFIQAYGGACGPHDGEIARNVITGVGKWGLIHSNVRAVGTQSNVDMYDNSFVMNASNSIVQLAKYDGTDKHGIDATFVMRDNRFENTGTGTDAHAIWRWPLIGNDMEEHYPTFTNNVTLANNGQDAIVGVTFEASGTRIVNNTTVTDVTTTGFTLRITLSEVAKVANFVDTVSPPLIQYSKQDDFTISEHVAVVTGRSANTTYYVRQDIEYQDGFTESGAVRTQKTAQVVVGTDSFVFPTEFSSAKASGWNSGSAGSAPAYLGTFSESHSDAAAGSLTTRITSDSAWSKTDARHVYSKRSAFNADDTLIATGLKIVRVSDKSITSYTIGLGPRNEFNWSYTNPEIMYGVSPSDQSTFSRHNVITGVTENLRDFPAYDYLTIGDYEGCQCDDDSKVVLIGTKTNGAQEIVAYDIANDAVLGSPLPVHSEFNWAGFCHNGEYIMIDNHVTGGSNPHVEVRDKNMNLLYTRSNYKAEHGDFAVDCDGNQVYVMVSGGALNYLKLAANQIVTVDNSAGVGWGHLSGRATKMPGYVYVSPSVTGTTTAPLVRVKLCSDGGTIGLLGFHRSNSSTYAGYPMGSVSNNGGKLVYASNYADSSDNSDYLLELAPA